MTLQLLVLSDPPSIVQLVSSHVLASSRLTWVQLFQYVPLLTIC